MLNNGNDGIKKKVTLKTVFIMLAMNNEKNWVDQELRYQLK